MPRLQYRTAGESHGQKLIVLIEGLPAGLNVDLDSINAELRRRQGGYGRGGRMAIEKDAANVVAGVRRGVTMGSPVAIEILNKDWRIDDAPPVHRPRPGHADLAGSLKWLTTDCRETLERASARETAARVAAGALTACLLREFDIQVVGYVLSIYDVRGLIDPSWTFADLIRRRDDNEVFCPDSTVTRAMIDAIKQSKKDKDTLGGIVEVQAHGHPPGLGSCVRWQEKLDGRLMRAVGSIQAFKGVEIGLGFGVASKRGSEVHDPIRYDAAQREESNLGFTRPSNRAGGIEGGMTNGQPIVLRAVMKPISTLLKGMESVNLVNRLPERSDYERSDICSVPAASVVAQNVVTFELAAAFLEKLGGDTMNEVRAAHDYFMRSARAMGVDSPHPGG